MPNEPLGLGLVRRDEPGLGLGAEAQRLTLGVQDRLDPPPLEVADRLAVELPVDPAWESPREDDVIGAIPEVVELLEQDLELGGRDVRAPLVDLRVGARGRVDDCSGGTRLAADADEVVQDPLGGQLLDDQRVGAAACEARRHDRNAELLQRPRDVDPFPTREGEALARAVTLPALEVRHLERAVDRGVEGDGDDQGRNPIRW